MAIICVCDLCGKPMSENHNAVHYVVKKRKLFYTPFESKWEYVDAHESCMEELFRVAEKQDDGSVEP